MNEKAVNLKDNICPQCKGETKYLDGQDDNGQHLKLVLIVMVQENSVMIRGIYA
jgi:hypothetical protein